MCSSRLGWRFIKGIDILPHYAGGVAAPQALHGIRGIFSHVREYPPWTPKRTQGALPLDPAIASQQLEELRRLPNRLPAWRHR